LPPADALDRRQATALRFGAGVVELVDARDSKSVRRGFGKPKWNAESPFLFALSTLLPLILNGVYIHDLVCLLDTYMDTTVTG
jgi:hypothetical protein